MLLEQRILKAAEKCKRRVWYKRHLEGHAHKLAIVLLERGFYQFKYITSGVYASVFDIGCGCILRMSFELPCQFPPKAPFNNRLGIPFKLAKDSNLYFEIFPRVEVVGKLLNRKSIDQEFKDSLQEKFERLASKWADATTRYGKVWDIHENNVGLTPTGQLVIIDPGCLCDGKKIRVQVVK